MAKRTKVTKRETVVRILIHLSERMFLEEMGYAIVSIDSREADWVLHNLLYGKERYPVLALLETGADVNVVGNLGYTTLYVSAFRDASELIERLLDAGANPAATCEVGLI